MRKRAHFSKGTSFCLLPMSAERSFILCPCGLSLSASLVLCALLTLTTHGWLLLCFILLSFRLFLLVNFRLLLSCYWGLMYESWRLVLREVLLHASILKLHLALNYWISHYWNHRNKLVGCWHIRLLGEWCRRLEIS